MTTDENKTPAAVAAPEGPDQETPPRLQSQPAKHVRRWIAIGTGVGIEVRDNDLYATVVRVRPGSVSVAGATKIADFRTRPAAEWGHELAASLRKSGAGHVAANVLLPRRDVIVRQVHLPGVADKDLTSAIQLQIDSLHPFADDDVYFSWSRLGSSPFVMVGIVRREILDSYFTLFTEAGIKVASLTWSAAVLYSASRVITVPPSGFVLAQEAAGEIEVYGESESRALYSASLPVSVERALSVARSELRLDPDAPVVQLSDLVPAPVQATAEVNASYATALAGACPWLAIEGNLLPAERRRGSSRIRLVPTIFFATTLVVLAVLLALQSRWADTRYLGVLQHEISRYQPRAQRVEDIDRAITTTRARSQMLDEFKRRAKLDMDTLAETTKLLPPPGWVTAMDLDRSVLQIAGETVQAEELLKKFDSSPLFEQSEFTMPISRVPAGEMFRIRARRQTPPAGAAAPALAPPAGPAAAPPQGATK